jgi:hypothetical protein
MSEPNLNPCGESNFVEDLNIDKPPPFCREQKVETSSGTIPSKPYLESQKDVAQDLSWLQDATQSKLGQGASALCDPQQSGHIINEQGSSPPNRNVVYRYAKSIRGTDEAVKDLFKDLVVIDENGRAHSVPIIWATQERAVAYILQENMRKDESLVVDRIRLPILAIHNSEFNFNQDRYIYHKAIDYLRDPKNNFRPNFTTSERFERDTIFGVTRGIPIDIGYTLYAWTMYEEDMNQILTQVLTKFSPIAYIRVKGISWEIGVKLSSIANNVNYEPGDKAIRVFKYQFGLTAETFVAQPIVRRKAVLKTRIDITDSPNEEDITEVLTQLEQAVKELEE